jgi:hypothetical protein
VTWPQAPAVCRHTVVGVLINSECKHIADVGCWGVADATRRALHNMGYVQWHVMSVPPEEADVFRSLMEMHAATKVRDRCRDCRMWELGCGIPLL